MVSECQATRKLRVVVKNSFGENPPSVVLICVSFEKQFFWLQRENCLSQHSFLEWLLHRIIRYNI